jgi:Domain of unknown function (DUF4873)
VTHEPGEEYTGVATIDVTTGDAGQVAVTVDLRGVFQPTDGRFHWYGRVAASPDLEHLSGATVTLHTEHGSAEARLSDVDPWGRFRITGVGRPPF